MKIDLQFTSYYNNLTAQQQQIISWRNCLFQASWYTNFMNIPLDKKIGIWGFGVTGKSAAHYFHIRCYHIEVLDKKNVTDADQHYLAERNIAFFNQQDLHSFLERNDYIFPTPGIDLAPYAQFAHKFLNELDLFYNSWHKPIIAITGSIGKTTVTHLLSLLLDKIGLDVATGGNIGTPMLDLIPLQNTSDVALLELSSFQLEHCKKFAPDLAVITNLYPNHLDRHGSLEAYLAAKATIFAHQKPGQQALVPWSLRGEIVLIPPTLQLRSGRTGLAHSERATQMHYFSDAPIDQNEKNIDSKIYYLDHDIIKMLCDSSVKEIIPLSQFPAITFAQNWLIIASILDICKLQFPDLTSMELTVPEHRLEKVATINNVDFYNDSKSTTTQSTLAAIERLKHRPILLLFGGLSKGVDRSPFVEQIKNEVKKMYCFGAEAQSLYAMCTAHTIAAESYETLDAAVNAAVRDMQTGDQIVLSPAGSSYDLYKDYTERGAHFKKLVSELQK